MTRSSVDEMVRGMGMGMKVLELLVQEIRRQGGDEEVIPFLTRPRFKENLAKVAKALIESDWRFPVSEIRALAEAEYREENYLETTEFLGHLRHYWWHNTIWRLGIPCARYTSDPVFSPKHPGYGIPLDILEMLEGQTVTYPLLVDKWMVLNWTTKDGTPLQAGDTIKSDQLRSFVLAEQKYFDFNS